MEENKNGKTKSISIALILLAVVVGFGFLIGLAQIGGGKKDEITPDLNPEISNYFFDEEGRFLAYFNSEKSYDWDINIPSTYSLTPTKVDMQMESSSISQLTNFAIQLKLPTFTITDVSGYVKEGNYEYFRTKYRMDFKVRKTITGTDYTTTILGENLFSNSSNVKTITIPNTVKTVEYGAFSGMHGHKELVFPEGIETIENAVCFHSSILERVTLPSTLKYIGGQAFEQCPKIEEMILPDGVETISGSSFDRMTNLKTITLSKNLSTIANYSITNNPNLTTVNFKEGNYTIGERAFQNCSALADINLPSTLTTIKARAFEGCSSLSQVILNARSVVQIENDSFPENVERFYVPDDLYNQYLESEVWSDLTGKIAKISELQNEVNL